MARSRKNRARGAAAARNPSNLTSGASRRANGPALHRRLRCEPLEDRRLLALITVTIADDSFDEADGFTSLREAIFAANTVPGDDEIRFDPGLFAAGARTILLTHGELAITEALTITGPGAELLKIDASGNDPTPNVNNADGSRIFNIQDGLVPSSKRRFPVSRSLAATPRSTVARYFAQQTSIFRTAHLLTTRRAATAAPWRRPQRRSPGC